MKKLGMILFLLFIQNIHFFQQIAHVSEFLSDPQDITDVYSYGAAVGLIPGIIIDGCLPGTVEIDTDQLAPGVEDRAAEHFSVQDA